MKVFVVLLLVGLVSANPAPAGTVCDICKAGVSQLQGLLSDSLVVRYLLLLVGALNLFIKGWPV